jgi:transcription elongation factor GreA
MAQPSPGPGAAQLLRSVGLLADGPGVWGRPISAQGRGVFVVEWSAPLATAPIDVSRVGKWIERVETLTLDGVRPTGKALTARIGSFWLPAQTVVYIGSSEVSVARRVAAMASTELGDRRPYAGGHWLRTLRGLEGARVYWSLTSATEEYEDALFDAFAASVSEAELATLPDRDVVLPFANLRRPDGRRKATGLRGAIPAAPDEAPPPPTHVVQVADGDAEGARGEPPEPRRRPRTTVPRAVAATGRTGAATSRPDAPVPVGAANGTEPDGLTVEGSARLRAELDHLTTVKRPEVIARIRTAKEHGDLKENSEYHAAREEQSFLEGRVQALEARLRSAVIVEAPVQGARVGLGSKVTVEVEGETLSYTIVGASESDPTGGRISSSSPVGRALVGRDVGDEIVIRTPAGDRHYRIVEIA